jgi:hypothetical protein
VRAAELGHAEGHAWDLARARVGAALVAVLSLVGLGLAGHGAVRVVFTGIAAVGGAAAGVLALVEVRLTRGYRVDQPPSERQERSAATGRRGALVVALVALAASQTWFVAGTSLAGGDLAPPVGTAWIGRLFEPWVWAGNTLGGPNTTTNLLPWALVDLVVHGLGGDGALAQRLWLTGLFVAAGLAAYWLLRVLRFSALGSTVGAIVWLFNPYVVSGVGVNDVYLAALVLLPIWPAAIVRIAQEQWRPTRGAVVIMATAPLAGFVYQNPPLLGMAALSTVVTLGAVGVVRGHRRFVRSAQALVLGFALLAFGSAYWLVPAIEALRHTSAALSSTANWAWTEHRASVANGLWLNTAWGWAYPAYYPYAPRYDQLPLALLRFLLPAFVFSALAFGRPAADASDRRRLRVVGAATLCALTVILFGTGTNLPGALIFDPVYHLPLGWLFREPGRFLMVAALAYAAMAAGAVDGLRSTLARRAGLSVRRFRLGTVCMAGGGMLLALATAFPFAGGDLLSAYRSTVPASHVRVPRYWERLAAEANRTTPNATVLLLPPDDFYQMPYTWGYYGNDGFIENLLRARVLDPSGQGYSPAASGVLRAVDQVTGALLRGEWRTASAISRALGVNELLLRGDIDSNYPGRTIASPLLLERALSRDPLVRLIGSAGPLRLYELHERRQRTPGPVFTTTSRTPDLTVLGSLPTGSLIVEHAPMSGFGTIRFLTFPTTEGEQGWKVVLDVPRSLRYRAELLPKLAAAGLGGGQEDRQAPGVQLQALGAGASGTERLTVAVAPSEQLLSNSGFEQTVWGPVGNCDAVPGTTAEARLSAVVLAHGGPGGSPALRLASSADRACEAERLAWHHGGVELSFEYRRVEGGAPSFCLWEQGPDKCADLPALDAGPGWHRYRAFVVPLPGTASISLFFYATPTSPGLRTVSEYADASVLGYPSGEGAGITVAVIGTPKGAATGHVRVVSLEVPVASDWHLSARGDRVAVDGVRAGWLVLAGERTPGPTYGFADWFDAGWLVSGGALGGLLAAAAWRLGKRRLRRRREEAR